LTTGDLLLENTEMKDKNHHNATALNVHEY